MDDNVKMILSHKMTIEQVKGIASPPQTFEWIPAWDPEVFSSKCVHQFV